ncbi:hypothetical protein L7F22_012105 [Adiantum nelumboides]|nr:hypothetical protein [Adiantum nelumboides]
MKNSAVETASRLLDTILGKTDETKGKTQDMVEEAKEKARETKDKAAESTKEANQKASEVKERAKKRASEGQEHGKGYLQSVADIIFGKISKTKALHTMAEILLIQQRVMVLIKGEVGLSGSNTVPLGKCRSFLKGSNRGESETKDWAEPPHHDRGVSGQLKRQDSHQDGSQRWGERFNHGHSSYVQGDPASNNSQSNNGRPCLKALISLPENFEMDELHKATNKIMHRSAAIFPTLLVCCAEC